LPTGADDDSRASGDLENTIFILVPSLNPDGVDIVTQCTQDAGDPLRRDCAAAAYHKYVGQIIIATGISCRSQARLIAASCTTCGSQIVYDVHQQGQNASRIWRLPARSDRAERGWDPRQEMNMIRDGNCQRSDGRGKDGRIRARVVRFLGLGRHYQAFFMRAAYPDRVGQRTPGESCDVRREDLSQNLPGYNAAGAELEPHRALARWDGGLRDIIDYQFDRDGVMLYQAAVWRETCWRNFFKVGQRQIERKTPHAFYVPRSQADRARRQTDRHAGGWNGGGQRSNRTAPHHPDGATV